MAKPIPIDILDSVKDRFWSRVAIAGKDDCWEWRAGRVAAGYGSFYMAGFLYRANRVAWAFHNATDPGDLHVCHTCDNPPCCNPAHLFLGTTQDNMKDMVRKGRRVFPFATHCPQGHAYSPENTYLHKGRHQYCKECTRTRSREWHRKRAARKRMEKANG